MQIILNQIKSEFYKDLFFNLYQKKFRKSSGNCKMIHNFLVTFHATMYHMSIIFF